MSNDVILIVHGCPISVFLFNCFLNNRRWIHINYEIQLGYMKTIINKRQHTTKPFSCLCQPLTVFYSITEASNSHVPLLPSDGTDKDELG
jgi:hypothetical protein